jgi:hypothetical protein
MFAQQSVDDACQQLGIGPARFRQLRVRVVDASLASLAPRAPGRPPQKARVTLEQVQALQQQVDAQRRELVRLQAQLELAMSLPALGGVRRGPKSWSLPAS